MMRWESRYLLLRKLQAEGWPLTRGTVQALDNIERYRTPARAATALGVDRRLIHESLVWAVQQYHARLGVFAPSPVFGDSPPPKPEPVKEAPVAKGRRRAKSNEPQPPPINTLDDAKDTAPSAKVYLVTWAQNATPVHEEWWATLMQIKAHRNAELVIVPGRYKNPTSVFQDAFEDRTYAARIMRYLYKGETRVNSHLTIFGQIPIPPTRRYPANGREAYLRQGSGIFGASRVALATAATNDRQPRLIATTGACTVANYTDSDLGRLGEREHQLAAVLVEEGNDGLFHLRHITFKPKTGDAYDLTTRYTPTGVEEGVPVLGITLGDLHACKLTPDDLEVVAELLGVLRPVHLVIQDAHDQFARNHHRRSLSDRYESWHLARQTDQEWRDSVAAELRVTVEVLDYLSSFVKHTHVARSNHDEALERWLEEADPKQDPSNSEIFFSLWTARLEAIRKGKKPDVLAMAYDTLSETKQVRFLDRNSSLMIAGVEHALHGDRGPNGSRGSAQALAKLGVKVTCGHSHTENIILGCFQTGCTPKPEVFGYNTLPSTNRQSHCILYPNGTRTLVRVIFNQWRAQR